MNKQTLGELWRIISLLGGICNLFAQHYPGGALVPIELHSITTKNDLRFELAIPEEGGEVVGLPTHELGLATRSYMDEGMLTRDSLILVGVFSVKEIQHDSSGAIPQVILLTSSNVVDERETKVWLAPQPAAST